MTSHDNSSPPLTPSKKSPRLPSEIAEAFLSWQPTVPSSWVTPPGTEGAGTPDSPHSDRSSPIRQDYYIPQMLIYNPDNLHLHVAHTPYSTPATLDAKDTCSHTSADSFPCPTPTPTPSPSRHTWQVSTLWDHYIQTQGFQVPDPHYHSPTPHWHTKKPKKYRLTPEWRFHQKQLVLLTKLTHGRILTRGLLGQIMGSHQQKALS